MSEDIEQVLRDFVARGRAAEDAAVAAGAVLVERIVMQSGIAHLQEEFREVARTVARATRAGWNFHDMEIGPIPTTDALWGWKGEIRISFTRERPGYELADNDTVIRCFRCGMVSHNPNDVVNRYCGNCHTFHEVRA
jgi:hypothetical protein